MTRMINKALRFAYKKHQGQMDDMGRVYFFSHLMQVFGVLSGVTNDVEILCAGLLHDTLEDTNTTYEELEGEFGSNVATIVHMVTHESSKDDKGYYFPRLNPTKDFDLLTKKAIIVKVADRLSNLSRMDAWDEKRQAHYLRRTRFWKVEEG